LKRIRGITVRALHLSFERGAGDSRPTIARPGLTLSEWVIRRTERLPRSVRAKDGGKKTANDPWPGTGI
jgi:hypothetical protein